MKKLRDSEGNHEMHLAPRMVAKSLRAENAMDFCQGECEAVNEVARMRELAMEQQEIIEYLRQGLRERERKLDQLSNKKRKEDFYRQWLELEPVVEVDDEEEHERNDNKSTVTSSPLSLQSDKWQSCGVTREAYEALLLEVDKLHMKYAEEQKELTHAKSQVRDLEKALLQETRGSQNSRRALSDKLNEAGEREANLLAEISELKEQNELLEFRVLELEESEPRQSPDTADSGVVSPEPTTQIFKDHGNNKHRVIATVIPYNSCTNSLPPILIQKSPLSLQESGIFEEDDDHEVVLINSSTQTETPAGELLQEVQRLQELRERIQERAAKTSVTPIETCEIVEDSRIALYKSKIQELEERLDEFILVEEKRSEEQLIVKQREEELLDENYRLTERVHWLTNELQKYNNFKKCVDIGTITECSNCDISYLTDNIIFKMENKNSIFDVISSVSRCQKIFNQVLDILRIPDTDFNSNMTVDNLNISSVYLNGNNKFDECLNCNMVKIDYEKKMQLLVEAERCLRYEINDYDQKKSALVAALKQTDTKWSQLNEHEGSKQEPIESSMNNQITTIRISEHDNGVHSNAWTNHLINHSGVNIIQSTTGTENSLKCVNISKNSCEIAESLNATRNIEHIDANHNKCDKLECIIDNSEKSFSKSLEGKQSYISQAFLYSNTNSSKTFMMDKPIVEEKIRIRRRNNGYDRVRSPMKSSKSNNRNKNCVKSVVDLRRLVLYPEICV